MAEQPEGQAVEAWSRISLVGQQALEDALTVFSPRSKDLLHSQRQLLIFLQGLREEGYQPTVLRSKDVYGYTACTCQVPAPGTAGTGPKAGSSSARETSPPSSSSSSTTTSTRKAPRPNGWLKPRASGVRLGARSTDPADRGASPRPSDGGGGAAPTTTTTGKPAGEAKRHRYPERNLLSKREPETTRRAQQRAPPEETAARRDRTAQPGYTERHVPPRKTRLQLLRSKVIKVDDSSSDEEVRRKAQEILRVNLSPVIKIRPITYPN
ncbi:coiled-coil domain-containing protein 71 [Heptranchias perlo]|uniref:coiled-coil domain-containing protein 71 n=1 Tax=Heptranchias perlo TaxID=212740 RepID=UPI00355A4309